MEKESKMELPRESPDLITNFYFDKEKNRCYFNLGDYVLLNLSDEGWGKFFEDMPKIEGIINFSSHDFPSSFHKGDTCFFEIKEGQSPEDIKEKIEEKMKELMEKFPNKK